MSLLFQNVSFIYCHRLIMNIILFIMILSLNLSLSELSATELSSPSFVRVIKPAAGSESDKASVRKRVIAKKSQVNREVGIIVGEGGYYPDKIIVFEGEKVAFYLTTTDTVPSCLIINAYHTHLSIVPGKIQEGVISFDKSGSYEFFCPVGPIHGEIVVLEKSKKDKSGQNKNLDRHVASSQNDENGKGSAKSGPSVKSNGLIWGPINDDHE